MRNDLDAMLGRLASQATGGVPDDFMEGVWERAGQLGEIAERRRRTAMFAALFVVGLGAGVGTTEWPSAYGLTTHDRDSSLLAGERLSPAALLHVGR